MVPLGHLDIDVSLPPSRAIPSSTSLPYYGPTPSHNDEDVSYNTKNRSKEKCHSYGRKDSGHHNKGPNHHIKGHVDPYYYDRNHDILKHPQVLLRDPQVDELNSNELRDRSFHHENRSFSHPNSDSYHIHDRDRDRDFCSRIKDNDRMYSRIPPFDSASPLEGSGRIPHGNQGNHNFFPSSISCPPKSLPPGFHSRVDFDQVKNLPPGFHGRVDSH